MRNNIWVNIYIDKIIKVIIALTKWMKTVGET
jgi:hypothetical protein